MTPQKNVRRLPNPRCGGCICVQLFIWRKEECKPGLRVLHQPHSQFSTEPLHTLLVVPITTTISPPRTRGTRRNRFISHVYQDNQVIPPCRVNSILTSQLRGRRLGFRLSHFPPANRHKDRSSVMCVPLSCMSRNVVHEQIRSVEAFVSVSL